MFADPEGPIEHKLIHDASLLHVSVIRIISARKASPAQRKDLRPDMDDRLPVR